MQIVLKLEPRSNEITIDIEENTTIIQLIEKFKEQLPYTILAAKRNNELVELNTALINPCKVELLDMRTQAANLIYQYSLCLIYLKAVEDVLGKVTVEIQNSINKGIYTMIKKRELITNEEVLAIDNRMREIVKADIPYIKQVIDINEATEALLYSEFFQKLKLLQANPKVKTVKAYSLDGYKDFFYGLMVPSTGYIQHFELKKYRKGVLLRFPHPNNPNVIPEFIDESKMYAAFGEATLWGRLMEVSYVTDLNEKVRNGQYKELIQLSEALHEKRIAEIADLITKQRKRIILIAGPSSSGKTTFAKRLLIQLKVNGLKPLYMGTDDYFVEREDTALDEHGKPNFEDISAIDIKLFNSNMNDLLAGKDVDLPVFDFMTGHKRFGERITSIGSEQPIIIEGIHALNQELTPYMEEYQKFKIYISPLTQLNIDEHNRIPTTDARMLRRMVRDYKFRGNSAKRTIDGWKSVRDGEDRNIFPYSNEADVFFNSVHLYELAVLKKYAEPLLKAITKDEPEYCEAVRLLKFLNFFEAIEDDSMIANNSILREFIGGSIFV
ncbi:nucleoside kinase [Clostridium aminobutyricum]|uniref:Nucleoside kinase n=1 Tax=Clostridium aminobutyricum TaxID=33953 RepID=A0A939D955_CLOAM|nr:nucleoside kinase [Clostridium aminobutyricum]MBN7773704.1 nucleoside kinase [Clostridium aminobutyricum]